MSLNFEQFVSASRRREALGEKVKSVLGYDPLTSDHWGGVHLYNVRITENITEEQILEIREKYEEWKKSILALLAKHGITPSEEQWIKMFDIDPMGGTIRFLKMGVNVDLAAECYEDAILKHLQETQERKKCWWRYDT